MSKSSSYLGLKRKVRKCFRCFIVTFPFIFCILGILLISLLTISCLHDMILFEKHREERISQLLLSSPNDLKEQGWVMLKLRAENLVQVSQLSWRELSTWTLASQGPYLWEPGIGIRAAAQNQVLWDGDGDILSKSSSTVPTTTPLFFFKGNDQVRVKLPFILCN